MNQWLERLTFLLLNDGEAMSMTHTQSAEEACQRLSDRTHCAVVKAGPGGAMAMERGQLVRVPARRVPVQDTTGAGDSFDAGFLYATLQRDMPLREALEFAAAVGSRSCAFVGGTAARSTYQDIVDFIKSTPPLDT
jgi:sugar/nucleoside kinase (ribokinase family)